MAISGTEDIGTAQTYTTWGGWENDIPADITSDQIYTGQGLGEAFAEGLLVSGHTTDATHYVNVIAKAGNEHDGRANEVSSAGNCRLEPADGTWGIDSRDEWCRFGWLEVKTVNTGAVGGIQLSTGTTAVTHIHHCIIHNNHAGSNTLCYAIFVLDTDDDSYIYRNIMYGYAAKAMYRNGAATAGSILQNTICLNNGAASLRYGVDNDSAATLVKSNAVMGHTDGDFRDVVGVLDWNCDSDNSDTEGANSLNSKTMTDQFDNATVTWADTDFTHKSGADIVAPAGHGTYATATYPEIDESISNRDTSISGTWDIGADQYVAAAGGVLPRAKIHASAAQNSVLMGGLLR